MKIDKLNRTITVESLIDCLPAYNYITHVVPRTELTMWKVIGLRTENNKAQYDRGRKLPYSHRRGI